MGLFAPLYSAIAHAILLVTFLYAIGFTSNVLVPKSIDIGIPLGAAGEPLWASLLIDALLLALFAVQHGVMAHPAFKRWWARFVPESIERSTFVLMTSSTLILLFAQWRPVAAPVWNLGQSLIGLAPASLCALGWLLVLAGTLQIPHFELVGWKQVGCGLAGRHGPPPAFRTPLLYRHVRHPIYLGFMLAFWSAPAMSAGHLLFAVATSGYILIGIWFEKRGLVAQVGQRSPDHRAQIGLPLRRLFRP